MRKRDSFIQQIYIPHTQKIPIHKYADELLYLLLLAINVLLSQT